MVAAIFPGVDSPTNVRKVLLVDDEVEVLRAIRRHLTRRGWEVHITTSPLEALQQVEALQPDAVVSDFKMAGMNGLQLLSQLAPRLPGVPLVLLTGYADLDPADLPAGVVMMAKPFDTAELIRRCMGE